VFEGIRSITHRLSDLPNGIHFTKISVRWLCEDVRSMMNLVSTCADTPNPSALQITAQVRFLRFLPCPIDNSPPHTDASGMTGIDLSQAAKLWDVVFWCGGLRAEWISKTLRTVEPKSFQRLSMESPRCAITGDTTW